MSEPQHEESRVDTARNEPVESPEADSVEQTTSVSRTGEDWTSRSSRDIDSEASEGDAMEQLQEVELDEDEYR